MNFQLQIDPVDQDIKIHFLFDVVHTHLEMQKILFCPKTSFYPLKIQI